MGASNTVEAIQATNVLTLSRGMVRLTKNNHGIKSLLAASNDECWITTSEISIAKSTIRKECK